MTQLVAKQEGQVIQMQDSAGALLARAIEKGADITTLERLLAMRKELKSEQSKSDFYAAMSAFQSECPVIKKERIVKGKDGKERYRYASLDDIVSVVSPLLSKNGLSFTTKAEIKQDFVIAHCIVSHSSGHSETSSFEIPIEKEAFMGDAQKSGSALTYAKRYAFCNAFGIMTGDKDDDAESLGGAMSVQDLYRKFAGLMALVLKYHDAIMLIKDSIAKNDYAPGAETWYQLDDATKMALWVAPTKGGPFTTQERDVMKSTEWREAYYGKGAAEQQN